MVGSPRHGLWAATNEQSRKSAQQRCTNRAVRLRTHAAKRFKRTRSGVCLIHQVIVRLSKGWRRLKSAHLCPTVTLSEASRKKRSRVA